MENLSPELNANTLGRKKRLKELLDEGQKIENLIAQQSTSETLEKISSSIATSNAIIDEGNVEDRSENTSEIVMDAQLMRMNHELLSKVIAHNSEFNESLYINAICNIAFKEDTVDWMAMENICCTLPHVIRGTSTMLGTVDITPKEHIVKQRQQRQTKTSASQTKCPTAVEHLKSEEKGAKKIELVYAELKELFQRDGQPLPFYKVIINPHNFMNTVDNAFQMSFLLRDNCIAIDIDEEGYPLLRLTTSEERNSEKESVQTICSLNMALCNKMIERYNIKEPMLKVRLDDDDDDDNNDVNGDNDVMLLKIMKQ